MYLRYDFGEKLDLSKFKKQASYYSKNLDRVTYQLFLQDYKITVEMHKLEGCLTTRSVNIAIYDIERDKDGEVMCVSALFPITDSRFKEIKIIQEIWESNTGALAYFNIDTSTDIIQNICDLIKIVHKINKLKAFI